MSQPFLVTTPIQTGDAKSILDLVKDKEIFEEFLNFRFKDMKEAEEYIRNMIAYNENSGKCFFQMTKIAFKEAPVYDDSNSISIGFVTLYDTGISDRLFSGGFNQNLGFAIKLQYRNKGLTTLALTQVLERLLQLEYTIVPAFVKHGNVASERVLQKCGFDKVLETPMGNTFVKRLFMNESEYYSHFDVID